MFGLDEACGLNSWMTNIPMAFNVYIHALPWCLWFKCMLTCLSCYDANNSTHCADALSLHIQHSTVTSFYAVWVYALIASALHCYFFLVCNFTILCAFTCMMRCNNSVLPSHKASDRARRDSDCMLGGKETS